MTVHAGAVVPMGTARAEPRVWHIDASPVAGGLPRAQALTDALLAGAPYGAEPDAGALDDLRSRVHDGLSAAVRASLRDGDAGTAARRTLLRIGHYQVARTLACLLDPAEAAREGIDAAPGPFRWTPRTARRVIGLAAVRLGLDGRARTPSQAVRAVMSDPAGPDGVGRTGPGSCADWLASLAPPARSFVAAEAATWTTRLWTALDWGRLEAQGLTVGGPDRWWRWRMTAAAGGREERAAAATPEIALRGRADVRVGACSSGSRRDVRQSGGSPRDTSHDAHLVVLDGHPRAGTRHALVLGALVGALAGSGRGRGGAEIPARVVGFWPDCGKAWVVPIDHRTLARGADAVVATAAALLGAHRAAMGGGHP